MQKEFISNSETQTKEFAARLAEDLYQNQPCFVQLEGTLGAGKTTFARGFIQRWFELSSDDVPEAVISPTYNLVKTYGSKCPIAHLDLYRIKDISELEQIGFETYFYEYPCVLIEWLSLLEQGSCLKPDYAVFVHIDMDTKNLEKRVIKIEKSLKSQV